ncbi:MAG: ATP-binding cassette domain-containing protein, partial [Rhodobacteraceae bacterium]|nr:ATP-binding cassette domain-containing protein [Paracoccaceae bacterium]
MIELKGLKKSFGNNHVLRSIDLVIPKGESMVIIGGSGTGKSVALKCILGLIKPDAGEILVNGRSALSGDRDAFLAQFGMLFQGGALFDSCLLYTSDAADEARS